MGASKESSERCCVGCGRRSPSDASEYTLFSSQHGWRVTKASLPSGKTTLEWRCPNCYAKYRATADTERPKRHSEAP